jgi:hypothetical protein
MPPGGTNKDENGVISPLKGGAVKKLVLRRERTPFRSSLRCQAI